MKMNNLSIETIAPNFTKVWIQGSGWIVFSYKTIIAFAINGKVIVRQNEWSTTTGKHLNAIDGGSNEAKEALLSGSAF
jgi:flavorubredoxin